MDVIESHCNTIAQAFLNAHNLPIAALKIILYSFYLSRLMGFTTVIIGGTLPILAIWLSRKLSKYQRRAQLEHMEATERTSALVSEALRGLRQIRLSSMECLWQKRIFAARNQNLAAAWKVSVFEEIVNLVATLGPVLFASVTISIYALRTGHFSPSVAFTSINLFGNLHAVIKQLPARFASLHRARISYSKLQTYLRQPEQTRNSILGNTISLQNANLSWVEDEKGPILKNVDLEIPKHGISVITGQIGSGKSLLLYSILEEAIVQSGKLVKPAVDTSSGHSTARGIVAGSAAFVSQPPWIEDCTIKENICFGYEFDEDRYRKVLHACALTHDLETLSNGDLTAAGTGGSLLSGGQKWRVAFARALYSPAESIISEDVLAAVDTAVARHLCDAALGGDLLRGRTMIMATHHPEYCSKIPTCLISLQNGSATVKHVQDSKQTLASLGQAKDLGLAPTTEKSHAIATDEQVHEATSTQKPTQHSKPPNYWVTLQKYAQKTGSLHGYMLAVPIVLCYRLLSTSNSWWLAKWTSRDNSISQQHSTKFDVGIYLSLSVASAMFLSVQTLIFTRMGHNSSRKLFESLTRRILKARLSWIDSTPPGQVIQTLDSDIFSSSPYTILFSAFMLAFYAVIARKALEASQRLRPILNSCNFPVSNHTASAQSGLTTIRAFGKSAYYIEAMREHIDRSNSAFTHLVIGHSWLGIRLGVMGSIFVATVTAATILSKGTASSTGLAITLALQLRQSLNITIGQINVTRTGLNAIDCVLGLASIPSEEEDGEQDGAVTPENWPSHGQVKVRKLGVRYSENLPWTLSNISFSVQAGQRLGIVGRTGAGKSSLINSLLRFVDATAGEILIDDQDISQVSRKRVRDAVTVIPQDAFLFSGTLRSNVDVFGKHNDDEVISALRSVHFTSFERKGDVIAADLDRTIHSGGSNVSHGQRQLVCLARVILEDRSRILILDEATSGVDHATETAIQEVIRENFRDMTVLVVAHKLLTVADFDKILVLSQGEVVEHGAPQQLLASKESEDCLHLNIVRPAGPPSNTSLPVLVWFHGGGFEEGSAADQRYNGSFPVKTALGMGSPIIFVSFNYRLGVWGSISGPPIEEAGLANIFMHDQRQALAWVQENIAHFGGDPLKVTVMGESAGAISIGYQLLAYGGRDHGLFRAAIAESGGPVYMGAPLRNSSQRANDFELLLNTTGCSCAADVLGCLRRAPTASINQASNIVPFYPTVDGDFLPDYSIALLQQNRFLKVPLLTGSNRNEGATLTQLRMTRPFDTDDDFAQFVRASMQGWSIDNSTIQNWARLYQEEVDTPSVAGLGAVSPNSEPSFGSGYEMGRKQYLDV
ncbi:hypothetical protein ARSEF1564_005075 [Beauveria bassiana]